MRNWIALLVTASMLLTLTTPAFADPTYVNVYAIAANGITKGNGVDFTSTTPGASGLRVPAASYAGIDYLAVAGLSGNRIGTIAADNPGSLYGYGDAGSGNTNFTATFTPPTGALEPGCVYQLYTWNIVYNTNSNATANNAKTVVYSINGGADIRLHQRPEEPDYPAGQNKTTPYWHDMGKVIVAGNGTDNVKFKKLSNETGLCMRVAAVKWVKLGQPKNIESIAVTGAGGASTITTDGGTLQMNAAVLPNDALIQDVEWSVVNGTGKATISNTGLLTAIDDGVVTVVASAMDTSGIQGSMDVTISGQIKVNTINVTGAGGASTITTGGGTLQMNAEAFPAEAKNKNVNWSVQNGTGVATISNTGLLTAIQNGTVTVVATAADGSGTQGSLMVTLSGGPDFGETFISKGTVFDSGRWIEPTPDVTYMAWTVNNGLSRVAQDYRVSRATSTFSFKRAFDMTVDLAVTYGWSGSGYGRIGFNDYVLKMTTTGQTSYTYALSGGGIPANTTNVVPVSDNTLYRYHISVADGGKIKIIRTNSDNGSPITLFDLTAPTPNAYGGGIILDGSYAGTNFKNVKVYYKPIVNYAFDGANTYSIDGNQVTANASVQKGQGNALVFACAYDAAGKLIGISETLNVTDATTLTDGHLAFGKTFAVTGTPAAVRVFAWRDMEDCIPSCASAIATAQ